MESVFCFQTTCVCLNLSIEFLFLFCPYSKVNKNRTFLPVFAIILLNGHFVNILWITQYSMAYLKHKAVEEITGYFLNDTLLQANIDNISNVL